MTKSGLIHEVKVMAAVFVYLALFLGGFAAYRRVILGEQGIGYFRYGYSLIEALVLAKVLLAGRMLHLGERYHDKPLFIPTLHKTLSFSILVFAFSIAEHAIAGLIHGKTILAALGEIASNDKSEVLAQTVVMFLAFVPLFAVGEISRVLGEGRLFELFFKRRIPDQTSTPRDQTEDARRG